MFSQHLEKLIMLGQVNMVDQVGQLSFDNFTCIILADECLGVKRKLDPCLLVSSSVNLIILVQSLNS